MSDGVVPTGAALVGAALPYTGLAPLLGSTPLPTTSFLLLFAMVVVYLVSVELAKARFSRAPHVRRPPTPLSPSNDSSGASVAGQRDSSMSWPTRIRRGHELHPSTRGDPHPDPLDDSDPLSYGTGTDRSELSRLERTGRSSRPACG
jgi:hypothetical protein